MTLFIGPLRSISISLSTRHTAWSGKAYTLFVTYLRCVKLMSPPMYFLPCSHNYALGPIHWNTMLIVLLTQVSCRRGWLEGSLMWCASSLHFCMHVLLLSLLFIFCRRAPWDDRLWLTIYIHCFVHVRLTFRFKTPYWVHFSPQKLGFFALDNRN